ncbi:MAG: polyprenol monophosphomannose synthase [Chloroflexi bacterium]|nr:polyprenol monophosphomannose synthase [Chloroflexota bacterium]
MKMIVVLPTYNEAENLSKMVNTLLGLPVENLSVLVVDDNSPDGTGQIADDLAEEFPGRVEVIHRPGKQGLGKAYIHGFSEALARGADYVLQMDCDFSHSPDDIPRMVEKMHATTCNVVIGSRYVKGGRLDENWGIGRKLLSWWANSIYVRMILRTGVHDATGGFRLWQRQVLQGIGLDRIRSNGYVFQVETIYVTEKLGYSIAEIPIYFADRTEGTSKMSLRVQLEAALRVWQVWWRHRALKPSMRMQPSDTETA